MKKEYKIIVAVIAFILICVFLIPKIHIPTNDKSDLKQYTSYRFWLKQMETENKVLVNRNKETQDSLKMYIGVSERLKVKVDSMYQKRKIVALRMSDDALRAEFFRYISNDTGNVLLALKSSGILEVLNNLYALDACLEKEGINEETIRKMSLANVENQNIIHELNVIMEAGSDTITSMLEQMKETGIKLKKQSDQILELETKNKLKGKQVLGLVILVVIETILLLSN